MRIGQKIRELREAKNLTPGQLAKACGLDAFYIHNFENGFNLPTSSALYQLAPSLGVSFEELDVCEFVQVEGVERWKYVPEVEEKKKVEVVKKASVEKKVPVAAAEKLSVPKKPSGVKKPQPTQKPTVAKKKRRSAARKS
jgi:transcriptional regulator with XRE-family HTH domain